MSEINSYLTIKVGSNIFGIEVENVVEILEYVPLKSNPESLPYILGLIEHRDQVVPLVDTGIKFGQPKIEIHDTTCIVVISVHNKADNTNFNVAVVADLVADVIEVNSADIKPIENSYKPGYIVGAYKNGEELVLVMNVDKIFSDTDVLVISELVQEVNC